jgi:ABC-type iron transport system FetAB ATPase subunit
MTGLVIKNMRTERLARTRYLHNEEDIVLSAGKISGLTGPSGVGKTLLFRAIVDLDPASGDIRLGSESRESMPAHEWRRRVCYLPAESAWWQHTVGEHFDKEPAPEVLESMGFTRDVLSWEVSGLSTGERQRLALLRCLVCSPEVLLLDEPTASLDAERSLQAEAIVQSYVEESGASVFWISHDREQLGRVADNFYTIDEGGLVEAVRV